jgi:lipopolysaccharide biosynthesis glycosyltransferase
MKRHFLFGCDEKMLEPMLVAWGGIYRYRNQAAALVFHWRFMGVSQHLQRKVATWCRKRNITLYAYDLTGKVLRSRVTNARLSEATVLRLLPLQELREQPERILYLDSDIVVQGSLDALFTMSFGRYACAAVDDPSTDLLKRKVPLGLKVGDVYCNTGVILINTRRWMEQQVAERSSRFLFENPEICPYEDQDGLNAVICGNYQELSEFYNRFTLFEGTTTEWIKRWAILHFAGPDKPWIRDKETVRLRGHAIYYWKQALHGLCPVQALFKLVGAMIRDVQDPESRKRALQTLF